MKLLIFYVNINADVNQVTFTWVIKLNKLFQSYPPSSNTHHHCVIEEPDEAGFLFLSKLEFLRK